MSSKSRTSVRRRIAPSLACAALALAAGAPALGQSLSLPATVDAALAKSPETQAAAARSRAAEAARDQVARSWAPQVSASGTAGYQRIENSRRIALGLAGINEYPLFAGVNLNQHLLDFGRRGADLSSRRALVEASYFNAQSVGQIAMLGAAQAYLDLLLSTRSAAVTADNLAFHERLAADMAQGVAKGALSISERQQADERLQSARAAQVDVNLQLEQARARFAAITGIVPPASLSPDALALPAAAGPLLPAALEAFVAQVRTDNPRLREARQNLRAAEANVRRARAEYLPQVDLAASARTGKDFDGFLGHTNDYQALATLRVPLFDGGVTAARVREFQAKADEMRSTLAAAERDSELQARMYWQRREALRARLEVEEGRSRVAADVLDSYKNQFTIGRRSLLDVLDAQASLYNARVTAETARISAILAELSLLASVDQIDDYLGLRQAAPGAAVYGPR